MSKTIQEHAQEVLAELLGREPTEQELGNMATDTWIQGQAIQRNQEDISISVQNLDASISESVIKLQ